MADNNGITIVNNTQATNQGSDLVTKVDRMLKGLEPPKKKCCIYRVPEKLRNVNQKAYTPHTISIGPFHYYNEKLKSMDQVKKQYMKKLVLGSGNSRLEKYIEFVKNWETRIRDCYSKRFKMCSNEFVEMILVDSCFIIQFLTSYKKQWGDNYDDSLSLAPWVITNISLDLILLENQIPFFVLEGLFSIATDSFVPYCFLDLALYFFQEFDKGNNKPNIQSMEHFTDLVLKLHQPPQRKWLTPGKEIFRSVLSATELNEAGVTFEVSSSKSRFDISFNNEVLQIPELVLDDHTEIYIRNLMALEICHYPNNSCMTDYIVFMDGLINTTRDVDLLVRRNIIENCLGDNKAAANLFNKLCTHVPIDDTNFYFSQVCNDLNKFYSVRWHKLKAMLKRDYFDTPWKTTSTIAAITLLVLTLIQTVCSIISTVNGK